MTEVYDFAQSDLDEEDVMMLDTWEEVKPEGATGNLTGFMNEKMIGEVEDGLA